MVLNCRMRITPQSASLRVSGRLGERSRRRQFEDLNRAAVQHGHAASGGRQCHISSRVEDRTRRRLQHDPAISRVKNLHQLPFDLVLAQG
jgi:hypothetical protein